jgi:hypothetical protein
VTIAVSEPQRTDISMFQQYRFDFPSFSSAYQKKNINSMGVGGPCSIFTPPESYWCSKYNSGGAATVFETPSGLVYEEGTFLKPLKNPKDAVMHVWHPCLFSFHDCLLPQV